MVELKGSSAIETEGKLQSHSCPDVDVTGSGSLLYSILSTLLKNDLEMSGWYCTRYITAAFMLASEHLWLEIKILHYFTLYNTVQYMKTQLLIEDAHMTMYADT